MLRIVFARRNSALFLVAAIWAIAFLFAGQSRAQVAGATLSGTITDPSGAAIATAEVSVTNKETGVNRAVVTDTAGFYSVPNSCLGHMMSPLRPGDSPPRRNPASNSRLGLSRP